MQQEWPGQLRHRASRRSSEIDEHCRWTIDEAHQTLSDDALAIALGPVIYKTQTRTSDNQGTDAYARDENGNFIVEAFGPGNAKMHWLLVELLRPEVSIKPRETNGVHVIGKHTAIPKASKPESGNRFPGKSWDQGPSRFANFRRGPAVRICQPVD
jgi:hypothetical protein